MKRKVAQNPHSPWYKVNPITNAGMNIALIGFFLLKLIAYIFGFHGVIAASFFLSWAFASIILILLGGLIDFLASNKYSSFLNMLLNILGLILTYLIGGILLGLIFTDFLVFLSEAFFAIFSKNYAG